jgi:hypothetical protein
VPKTALQSRQALAGAERIISVDFSGLLDTGETLDGTPTVVEEGTSVLSFTQKQTNSVPIEINGVSVPVDHAVMFKVDLTGVAEDVYTIKVTCDTTAGQTNIGGFLKLRVVE